MKHCTFCGSEIQEEAIRCRYCRKDLLVEPASAPAWIEPSLGYSFSGHRFVLGWTERQFAIWDRGRIDHPALCFPRTPGGWEMAWNRFIGMEPGAVAVGGRASIPELGSRPYWVSTRLPAVAIVTIAGAALLLLAAAVVEAVVAITSAPTILGRASTIDEATTVLGLSGLALSLTTVGGIAWILWQHRAHADLRSIAPQGLHYRPAWSIAGWLVPLVNLLTPPVILDDMVMLVTATGTRWFDRMGRWVVLVWWLTLVSSLALFFTIGQFDPTRLATRHAIVMHLWTTIALDGLFISAGVLAIVLVLGITHRVERMGQHAGVARPTPLLIAEGAR